LVEWCWWQLIIFNILYSVANKVSQAMLTCTPDDFHYRTNLRDRSRIETPSHDLQIPEALPEEQQIPVPELAQLIIDQEIPLADGEVNPDQPDQLQQTPALIVEPEDLHGKVVGFPACCLICV